MAEILNPTGMMMSGDGGLFGGGGGLIGGLILGSLLRNNGNLFGNNNVDGVALGGARIPPEQSTANMSLMQSIGAVDKSVAVASANAETSNALQSSTIQAQLTQVAQSTVGAINAAKDSATQNSITLMQQLNGNEKTATANAVALMQQLNGLDKNVLTAQNAIQQSINTDGDRTRALITQQYEATLNRQLTDANAAIIELRGDQRLAERTRGIEINTTNNINQLQNQQQQQQQFQALVGLVSNLANDLQYIRATNQAINIGGTQTANPTNNNTNVRA